LGEARRRHGAVVRSVLACPRRGTSAPRLASRCLPVRAGTAASWRAARTLASLRQLKRRSSVSLVQRQIAAEAAQRKHKEDELMLNDPETVAVLKDQVQVCQSHAVLWV
jgi:hypothetical protein